MKFRLLTNSNSSYRQVLGSWLSQFKITFEQIVRTISGRIFITLDGAVFLFSSIFLKTTPNGRLYKAFVYQILFFIILCFLILVPILYNFNSIFLSFILPYFTFILQKEVISTDKQIPSYLPGVERFITNRYIYSNLHEQSRSWQIQQMFSVSVNFNPFHATSLVLYPLKTEN